MTEQPDTAAIRAMIGSASHCSTTLARELCDALDAARAERDDLAYTPNRLVKAAIARAEAAVAVTERLTGELDAAEARIAATLAEIDKHPMHTHPDVRRALTS